MIVAHQGYRILDPRPIAAEAPYTFCMPAPDCQAAVMPGDLVKLMFSFLGGVEQYEVERMWLTVTVAAGDQMQGVLDNTPYGPTATLRAGHHVTFARHQIIDIMWADASRAPPQLPRREYRERGIVDDCVLDGSEQVELIYRETPDMDQEGGTYPDSGWRIRGHLRGATAADLDARKGSYIAIGRALNEDDSWLHLIDMPIGARFVRDFERGEYFSVP